MVLVCVWSWIWSRAAKHEAFSSTWGANSLQFSLVGIKWENRRHFEFPVNYDVKSQIMASNKHNLFSRTLCMQKWFVHYCLLTGKSVWGQSSKPRKPCNKCDELCSDHQICYKYIQLNLTLLSTTGPFTVTGLVDWNDGLHWWTDTKQITLEFVIGLTHAPIGVITWWIPSPTKLTCTD